MPNPAEVAELIVAGVKFEDWESVWVQHRWMGGWPLFRFTAAEGAPIPKYWTLLQFKPGDPCQIELGGQLAITGIILTRQTSYDANNHVVELAGAGRQYAAGTSSVVSKDGNFDKMPFVPIAAKVYAALGVNVVPVGSGDQSIFEQVQVHPGELSFDFVERLARDKGWIMGSDHLGNVLVIGDHPSPIVQELTEGQNILKMQCIISHEMLATIYASKGQAANAEDMPALVAAQMAAKAPGSFSPSYFKYLEIPIEQPGKLQDVVSRTYYEARFREGTLIKAFVTVQGWLRDGKALWRCGDSVWVYSPMAMLNMAMSIQTATFQQDNQSGTTTVLELVLPWMLGAQTAGSGSDTPYPQGEDPMNPYPAPAPATVTSDQPPSVPDVPMDVTQTQPM